MKGSWIGSVAKLALGLACAVALSMAPFGCSQNKGSVTQTKHSAGCPKDCKKPCCAKAAGTCPEDCPKATGECPKDCPKAAGTCPHADKKACSCKKGEGKCQHCTGKPCPGKKAEGE